MSPGRERLLAAWCDILAGVAAGELVKDVLARNNVTRTILSDYILTDPAAKREWDNARETSADAFMDEALAVARDPHVDLVTVDGKTETVRRHADATRVLVDTLKWSARIRNPRQYSDKSQVDVNVRTVDLTQIIRDAELRLANSRQGQLIEGTAYNRVMSDTDTRALSAPDLPAVTLDPALLALL
jgi:hypothetical protein